MDKIKILHMPIYAMGGVNQYVLKAWEFIDKSKFHFDFATLSKQPPDVEEEVKRQGSKVHYISCYAEDNERQFIDELNAIFDEGYDCVHLHTSFWRGFLMEEVAIQRNIPMIIVHSHSIMIDIAENEKRAAALKSHALLKEAFNEELATHFCACSNDAANWLFGEHIPREKIKILKNGIDAEAFSYKPSVREKVREKLSLKDSFVIGHAGRFSYQKNHDMLAHIFSGVCKHIKNARLMLIGDGPLEKDIAKKIDDLGLSDKVLFLGVRGDVADLMQAMDVFAFPSRFEGLGIALIEAQAAGLKCLVSEVVPVEAGVAPNLEFLPCDNNIWVDRIVALAKSGCVRADMSQQIKNAGYDMREQVKVLEKIYSGIT